MGKTNKNVKKTILTEDLFNANGNNLISNEALNESKNDEKETIDESNDDTIEENILPLNDDKVKSNDILNNDKVIKTNDELIITNINNKEISQIKNIQEKENNITSIKKRGFNDEKYYK